MDDRAERYLRGDNMIGHPPDKATRVLLVDDDPDDAHLARRALTKAVDMCSFDIEHAETLCEALERLQANTYDVLLLDLGLPETTGLETLQEIRQHAVDVPIVVLSGLDDERTALKALDFGAQDYVLKGSVNSSALVRSIRYSIHRQQISIENRDLLQQLQQQQELLEDKNRRLAKLYQSAHQFVDNVSHEFRTPLTVIREYASLMLEGVGGDVSKDHRQFLDVMSDRTDDLAHMVDDMLDVSKLKTGLLPVSRKKCQVHEIVDHIHPMLQRKASIKQTVLQLDVPDEIPEVYCDSEKIGRVIINLAVNAIKFAGPEGHVKVWARHAATQSSCVIGVTDDGPGIDQENLAAIFERFQQVGGEGGSNSEGFGLGLNIARELVHLNFGEMRVESQLGEGSTFSFSVPLALPEEILRRYLDRIERIQNGSSTVTLVRASIAESSTEQDQCDLDELLSSQLRHNELIFRAASDHWLIVLPFPRQQIDAFFQRIDEAHQAVSRNRLEGPLPKLQWDVHGTWNVATQAAHLLKCATSALQPMETAHG